VNDLLLRACRLERTERTPIWLMRQAGRYLPSYRRLRRRHDLLTLCRSPELAAKLTLLPVEELGVDAAILFHDLSLLLEAMGARLQLREGVGPMIENRVQGPGQVEALRVPEPEKDMAYLLEAIRRARALLKGKVPLIGFAGAPFTLACYLIEGAPTRDFSHVRRFMYEQPAAWRSLMEKLAQAAGRLLRAQVEAGAQAVQLFDTWAGWLGKEEYEAKALPYAAKAIEEVRDSGAPVIYFMTGATHLLEKARHTGAQVLGIDWRLPLDEAWERAGFNMALQGNLDPAALFCSPPELRRRALDVLRRAAGRPGHIFNLGHGILPDTPPESVKLLVSLVKAQGRSARS